MNPPSRRAQSANAERFLAPQHHPPRVLMRRGEHHGPHGRPARGQPVRIRPARPDLQRHGGQPGRVQHVAVPAQTGVLGGYGPHPEPVQHPAQQRQARREPGRDHHGAGVGADASGPGHVAGHRGAQHRQASGLGVIQVLVGRGRQGAADARSPVRSGE